MNDIPDYKSYTLHTLEDVLKKIDREQYPDRVKIIEDEIALKKEVVIDTSSDKKDEESKKSFNVFWGIAGGTLFFGLFGINTIFTTSMSIWLIPFYITCLLMLIGSILVYRKSVYGPEILKYSFILQIISMGFGGFKYSCAIGSWLTIEMKGFLNFAFNMGIGNVDYKLSFLSPDKSEIYIGANLVAIFFYFLIKDNEENYKESLKKEVTTQPL